MAGAPWPARARSACAFTFDLDAESLWLGRGVEEPVALSQGRFGVTEGLPAILALLKKAGLRSTFFSPGWVADQHPEAVSAIVSAGHEVGCHGYRHERVSDLPREEEESILRKSVETLERHTGSRPRGYRAPGWQVSAHTLALLVQCGFDYSSNFMDALRPRYHPPVDGHRLVEIPVSWVLDDAPFFLFTGNRSIQAPRPVLDGWIEEFRGIHRAGGSTVFTFHPQIIGRPSRLACLEALVGAVRKTPKVWATTLGAISAHWRKACPS